jgi:hypothetical protein
VFVVRHPRRFGEEVSGQGYINSRKARTFRGACIWTAALSVAISVIILGKTTYLATGVVFLVAIGMGAGGWMFFWIVTKVGEHLVIHQPKDRSRFAELLPFTAGPLALFPVVPVVLGWYVVPRGVDTEAILLVPIVTAGVHVLWVYETAAFHYFGGSRPLSDVLIYAVTAPAQWLVVGLAIAIVTWSFLSVFVFSVI